MPVFEVTLSRDSQDFVEYGDLDLNTGEETRRQDLQQTQSRDLLAVARDAWRSSGTQHESGGHSCSQALNGLFDVFS